MAELEVAQNLQQLTKKPKQSLIKKWHTSE